MPWEDRKLTKKVEKKDGEKWISFEAEFEDDCPSCGNVITYRCDTNEWSEAKPGVWKHSGYWPPIGDCETCDGLIADMGDGTAQLLKIPEKK